MTLIDFNSLSIGVQASPVVLSGVTFSGGSVPLQTINTNVYPASITYPLFVSGPALGEPDTTPGLPNFTITFASSVAQVGFGLFDPNFPGTVITAYDSVGNPLETTGPDAFTVPTIGDLADYVGFVRSSADIKRIEIVASTSGAVADALWIDNLSFSATPVPEPTSFALLGVGLVCLAARVRRSRTRR